MHSEGQEVVVLSGHSFIVDASNRVVYGWGIAPATPDLPGGVPVQIGTPFFQVSDRKFYFWTGAAWSEIPAAPRFNASYWDDLTGSAAAINPTGPDGAMGVSAVDGLLEAPNTGNSSLFASYQLPHQYLEGSAVRFHVHCYKETGVPAAADALAIGWEYRHKWIGVGGAAPAADGWVADWASLTESSAAPCDAIRKSGIYEVELTGSGRKISDRLVVALRRNVADAYDGVVRVEFVDVHVQKDAMGSEQEYLK
jgi:hypothetical protein